MEQSKGCRPCNVRRLIPLSSILAITNVFRLPSTSSKKSRLEGYLDAADLPLTISDIAEIDKAGAKGEMGDSRTNFARRVGVLALIAAVVLGACAYLGIDVV